MQPIDIRPLKKQLRLAARDWRSSISSDEKDYLDRKISKRVLSLREYIGCRTLLIYVSKSIEVDTARLIRQALADGKQVAVPRCIENSRNMEFYLIRSTDDLAPQSFGVLEPIPEKCRLLIDFRRSICIVPGLAYDREGYRLGYGGGYYDRFLSRFYGAKIGIIYSHDMHPRLWHGRFDVPVDLVVTEQRLFTCRKYASPRFYSNFKKR